MLITFSFFFFNDTATTEIYTLSLHDAFPISATAPRSVESTFLSQRSGRGPRAAARTRSRARAARSEEHTSELQSHHDLVCRLLLEKKKKRKTPTRLWEKNSEGNVHIFTAAVA